MARILIVDDEQEIAELISDVLKDEGFETELLDKSSREFLDFAISEYNKKFKTNFSSDFSFIFTSPFM